jgi:hypothetical protein
MKPILYYSRIDTFDFYICLFILQRESELRSFRSFVSLAVAVFFSGLSGALEWTDGKSLGRFCAFQSVVSETANQRRGNVVIINGLV